MCTNYGLELTSGQEHQDLCHPNVEYEVHLSSQSKAKLQFWSEKGASFNFVCNAWCTEDGLVPKSPPKNDSFSVDLIHKMVKALVYYWLKTMLKRDLLEAF